MCVCVFAMAVLQRQVVGQCIVGPQHCPEGNVDWDGWKHVDRVHTGLYIGWNVELYRS